MSLVRTGTTNLASPCDLQRCHQLGSIFRVSGLEPGESRDSLFLPANSYQCLRARGQSLSVCPWEYFREVIFRSISRGTLMAMAWDPWSEMPHQVKSGQEMMGPFLL